MGGLPIHTISSRASKLDTCHPAHSRYNQSHGRYSYLNTSKVGIISIALVHNARHAESLELADVVRHNAAQSKNRWHQAKPEH